jgi:hypothetical protein
MRPLVLGPELRVEGEAPAVVVDDRQQEARVQAESFAGLDILII